MTNKKIIDLKSKIEKDLKKNITEAYEGNFLEYGYSCVKIEDTKWAHYLRMLSFDSNVKALIKKINENEINLWESDLENCYNYVILEDVESNEDDSKLEYNGWYEELCEFLKKDLL